MRVVTFQSRDVTEILMATGRVETVKDLVLGRDISAPHQLRRTERDGRFVRLDNEVIFYNDDKIREFTNEIFASKKKQYVFPIYAYHKHAYCAKLRNMSISTIFHLAAHFIGSCGYDMRDIIELEVPDDEILEIRKTDDFEECLLPYIKKDWVISILWFDKYITDAVYGETSLAYQNEVFNLSTYRMCYSTSVVLAGHGYGDNVACCMSSKLLPDIVSNSVQQDYVQPNVYNLFKRYLYAIRHDLPLTNLCNISGRIATAEMPDVLDKSKVQAFSRCMVDLCIQNDVTVFDNDLPYKERIKVLPEKKQDSDALKSIIVF